MPLVCETPVDYNENVVGMLCDNDLDGLKQLHANGTKITMSDYLKAVDVTNGSVINNSECLIYLNEIDVLDKHLIMLDGAMRGNIALMKYAESKGEDPFYYKVVLYILNNPNNPARMYICRRLIVNRFYDFSKRFCIPICIFTALCIYKFIY